MTRSRHLTLAAALSTLLLGCDSNSLNNDGSADDGAAAGTGGGGGGGRGGNGGSSAVMNCGDPYAAIDPTAIIDDMEIPNFLTAFGNGSSWWAGGDDTSKANGASITPDGSAPAEAIPGGRCGSKYAMRVTGHGFGEWATLNVSMGYGTVDGGAQGGLPYDASFRTGITFWARVGDTSTDQARVAITDKYSSQDGGICDKTPGAAQGTGCYDHFGTSLTYLSTEWKQFRIPFLGLKQQNFGIPRPRLDTASLYAIEFSFPLNSVFDFWVDDISFY